MDEEILLMSCVDKDDSKRDKKWFLDSGCSNHMVGDKKWFINLNESFKEMVKLGNNSKMNVKGKGNIRIQIHETTQVIIEVYYIPELKNNLISIRQLQEKDLAITIQYGVCKVYHPIRALFMQIDMTKNRMCILPAYVPIHTQGKLCFQTTSKDTEAHLWHRRFGHLNMKGLTKLAYKKLVKGLPILKASPKLCTDCIIGK